MSNIPHLKMHKKKAFNIKELEKTLKLQTTEKRLERLDVEEDLTPYFARQKNPKIFLFYLFLTTSRLYYNSTSIAFSIAKLTYQYDICEKTIKLWLKELVSLGLIIAKERDNQLYHIEMLDYKNSFAYHLACEIVLALAIEEECDNIFFVPCEKNSLNQIDSKISKVPSQNSFTRFPHRFFKDMFIIVKNLAKQRKNDIYIIDNQEWRLRVNQTKFVDIQDIWIEFERADNEQFVKTLPYQIFTGLTPPPLTHPFHQKIIRANIKKALDNIKLKKGEKYEFKNEKVS